MATIPLNDDHPSRRAPIITYALIAVNVIVFLTSPAATLVHRYGTGQARVCSEDVFFAEYAAVPRELVTNHQLSSEQVDNMVHDSCTVPPYRKSPVTSVLTSMFLHGNWLHLLFNMLFLYVFGAAVEDRLGRARYLLAYLAFGYIAAYGFAITYPSTIDALIGASGAIAGVLGTYFILYPRARITALVTIFPFRLPAWVLLGVWFVQQWFALKSSDQSQVAYVAHIYGFSAGMLAGAWLRGTRRRAAAPYGWR